MGIGLEVSALGIGPDVDAAAVPVGIDDAIYAISSIWASSAAASAATLLLHCNDAGFHGLEGHYDIGVGAVGRRRRANWRGGARTVAGSLWGQ